MMVTKADDGNTAFEKESLKHSSKPKDYKIIDDSKAIFNEFYSESDQNEVVKNRSNLSHQSSKSGYKENLTKDMSTLVRNNRIVTNKLVVGQRPRSESIHKSIPYEDEGQDLVLDKSQQDLHPILTDSRLLTSQEGLDENTSFLKSLSPSPSLKDLKEHLLSFKHSNNNEGKGRKAAMIDHRIETTKFEAHTATPRDDPHLDYLPNFNIKTGLSGISDKHLPKHKTNFKKTEKPHKQSNSTTKHSSVYEKILHHPKNISTLNSVPNTNRTDGVEKDKKQKSVQFDQGPTANIRIGVTHKSEQFH